jgi:hypothetical protein
MKTILIPTDFNTLSLQPIPALVKKFYPEEVNILLVHMMGVTDCVRELLMLSRRSSEYQHISHDFYNACNQLKAIHNGELNSLRIEFFYGNTVAVFKNFLEANDVDAILHTGGYNYKMLNKSSIHPSVLTNKCRNLLITVDQSVSIEKHVVETVKAVELENQLSEQYA